VSADRAPDVVTAPRAPLPEPAAEAPLELTRASRWYGQVIALNDITVRVPKGVTGLLGPNGAGKSTFLKLAAGQLRPSQGEVRLLGRPAWGSPEVFHRVGLCPEADAFWEHLTGLQFVTTLLRLTGFGEAECRRRAENALHQVELLDAKDRKIGGYSKGMRQRVKLAQAIAHDPEVLLLDEPVSGMDPVNRRRVIDLVRRLGREGKTVVVSSHILHEVEAMTRRVLLVHNGRILAEGDVREIRELMDEHPHTVALRARDPRRLATAIVGWPNVVSVTFAADGEWVTVQTARPDEFYRTLHDAALEAGVVEMFSPDENLESVFRYLVAR
jgi:ABC-2 type transport system ATP-binding protein